ncbi:MAG: hypothetical protein E7062_04475 [Spirochaetaceae bacterium]|nr:hypothetical protein [Spirochaetaceae bacterium]
MKNTLKLFSLIAVMAIFASPLFAQEFQNRKPNDNQPQRKEWQKDVKDFQLRKAPKQDHNQNITIMGEIIRVIPNSQTIIVRDIDGKDKKVHINRLTKIIPLPKAQKNPPKTNFAQGKNPEMSKPMTFDSLKEGYWVAISSFDTRTAIAEGKQIFFEEREIKYEK